MIKLPTGRVEVIEPYPVYSYLPCLDKGGLRIANRSSGLRSVNQDLPLSYASANFWSSWYGLPGLKLVAGQTSYARTSPATTTGTVDHRRGYVCSAIVYISGTSINRPLYSQVSGAAKVGLFSYSSTQLTMTASTAGLVLTHGTSWTNKLLHVISGYTAATSQFRE